MKKRLFAWLVTICMVLSLLPCTALADEPEAALDLSAAVYSTETAGQWTLQGDGSYKYNTAAVTVNGQTAGSWAWYYNSDGTYTLELDGFQVEAQNINSGIKLPNGVPNGVKVAIQIKGAVKLAVFGDAIYGAYTKAVNIFGVGEAPSLTCIMASQASTNIYCGEDPDNNVCDVKIQNLSLSLSATDGGDENGAILCSGSLAIENCKITAGGQAWALSAAGSVTICNSTLDISNVGAAIMCGGDLSIADTQIDIAIVIDEEHNLEFDGKEAGVGILCAGKADISGQNTQIRIGYSLDESIGSGEEFYFKEFPTNDQLREIYGIPEGFSLGTKSITGGTYNWDVSSMVQSPYGVVENESRPWDETVDTWTVQNLGYTVTNNVQNTTLTNTAPYYIGQEYHTTLVPGEGRELPEDIEIRCAAPGGDRSLSSWEFSYNHETGEIVISESLSVNGAFTIYERFWYNWNLRFVGGSTSDEYANSATVKVAYYGSTGLETDTLEMGGSNNGSGFGVSGDCSGQTATLSHTTQEDSGWTFLGWYQTGEQNRILPETKVANSEQDAPVTYVCPVGGFTQAAVFLYSTAKEVAALFGANPSNDKNPETGEEMDTLLGPYTNDGVTVVFDWDTERWQVTLNNDIQDITLPARTDGELYLTINLNDHNITGSNGTAGNPNGKTALTLGDGYDLTITGPGEIVGGSGADSATGAGGNGGNGIDDGIVTGCLTLKSGVIVRGGQGGNGAPGKNGGNGGIGVTLDDSELMAMDAYIYGGAGGKGGDAANGNAGSGGIGGAGAAGTGSACIMFVGGAISGGSGGAGGNATNGSGGSGGQGGDGLSGAFEDLNFIDGKLYDEATEAMGGDEFLYCTGPAAVTGGDGGKGGDAANGNAGSGGTGGVGISANFSGGLMNLGAITGGGGGDGGSAVTDTIRVDLVGQGGSGGTAVSGTGHQYTLEEIFGGVQPPVEITTGTSVPGETGKNGTVRLTADIPGPVIIPDNLGEVTIDLNGHDIYGQSGTSGNPDGGDAIIMTHENGGTGTTLTIIDTSNGEKGVVRGGDGYPGSGGSGGNGITVNPEAENPEINIGAGVTVIGGNGANSTTGDGGNGGSGVDGDVNNNNGAITGGNGGSGKTEGGDGGSGVTGNVNNNGGAITDGNGGNSDNGAGGSGGNGDSNDNGNNGGNGGGSGATTYYTLRFAANGGSDVAPIRKVSGSTITLNQTSARDGYCFTGWYLDEACTEKVTSVKLTKDLTVYAGWQKDTVDPNVSGVSKWLITGDHVKYLNGYPNGLFGPDDDMTRAEVSQMLYNLLLDKDVSITKTFPDVPDTLWCAKAVNTLASLGVIYGYPDGSFGPNDKITREQFCAIVTRFANKIEAGDMEYTEFFSDVSSRSWSYDSVMTAVSLGWIHGYGNGLFGPTDNITRAQAVTIVNRMLGRSADQNFVNTSTDIKTFSDLSKSHWAYYAIMEATNTHDYKRNGTYETWDDLQ